MSHQSAHISPLCDVCQTLDLAKTDNREVAKYELGTWEDVKRKAEEHPRCPSCVLLRSFTKRTQAKWYESGDASIRWKAEGGFFFSADGDNVAFLGDGTAKSPYGYARPVRSTIEPSLIKKWMKLCEVHHGETCKPKRGIIKTAESDGVKVLRVIDTKDQCIVEAVPDVRYLTLSYVWGPVIPSIRLQKDNIMELSTKGALTSYQQQFPKTISDAIDLVQLIGERYLWVDSLCLIQDDDNDMLDGISHMDLVYQCAVLTIIAAHGEDANVGLPGVHTGSRDVDQEIIEVLPGIKMTATIGVYNAMQGAHSSRGWTLQELVLSHSTLIFTKDRIYFRCRANCWSEDTIYDNFPSAINKVLSSGNMIPFLADNEQTPLPAYVSKVFTCGSRNLTKEADRIHALTGILRFLSIQARSGLLEGLFTSCFDITILFWDCFPGPRGNPAGRRPGFPSWSWAGWKRVSGGYGSFCEIPDEVNTWLQTMTYIVWYKRSPKMTKLELVWDLDSQLKHGEPEKHHIGYRSSSNNPYGRATDRSLGDLKTRPDDEDVHRAEIIREEMIKRNYHFLHFFAHVVLVQGFADPPKDTIWALVYVYKILGAGGRLCGGIKFDDPKLMDNGKAQGPHELVLLSKLDRYDNFFNDRITFERPFYWVMLIVWLGEEKGVAERRGIGFFFQDCMKRILQPGKVWKEIVLA